MKLLVLALLSAGLSVGAAHHTAVDRISAESLRGNLSFLASDALEGRGTPSRGLDLAADFIAAQFRRAGLEPLDKDGSYFQPAKFAVVTPNLNGFSLTLKLRGQELQLDATDVRVRSLLPLDLHEQPVLVLPANGAIPAVEGLIVAGEAGRYGGEAMLKFLQTRRPALILLTSRHAGEPQESQYLLDLESPSAPVLRIINEDAADAVAERSALSVSVRLPSAERRDVVLRNVAGLLRGSDPSLRDQYLIVSSHYDHLGMRPDGSGDRIYNGANDNGSGTVSVIEIAGALAAMPVHPGRSILFLTLFGEEEGLLGSYFYTEHPLVPLRSTVADINLEMLGRTDDPAGPEVGAFALTGAAFSDLAATMSAAAKAENVKVYSKSDNATYFDRSDNYAFALAGIVAHTLIVAFDYPDYHAVSDEWQKIDYANMARVDQALAAGIIDVADAADPAEMEQIKRRCTISRGRAITLDAKPILNAVARVLREHGLDAILIGNAAAALQGAPVTTIDLDFLIRKNPANVKKLQLIADSLGAVLFVPFYPVSGMFRFSRDEDSLQLDFMTQIHGISSFNSLRSRAAEIEIDGETHNRSSNN